MELFVRCTLALQDSLTGQAEENELRVLVYLAPLVAASYAVSGVAAGRACWSASMIELSVETPDIYSYGWCNASRPAISTDGS